MAGSTPSALVTDQGRRAHLRIQGRLYERSQEEIRALLDLPPGPAGLGITIDRNRFCFESMDDNQTVELSAEQLRRRLAKHVPT